MKLKYIFLLLYSFCLYSNPESEHQLPPDNTHAIRIYNKTLLYFKITTMQGNSRIRPLEEVTLFIAPEKIIISAYGALDFNYSNPLNQQEKSISKYTKKLLLYPSDNHYGWEISTSFFPW